MTPPAPLAEAGPRGASWLLAHRGREGDDQRAIIRLRLAGVLAAMGFLVLACRASFLGLVADPEAYPRLARLQTPPVERATIVDRNGALLAANLMTHSLWADTREVWDPKAAARALGRVLPELDVAATEKRLSSGRAFVWLARQLTPRQRQAVFSLGLPGLDFREEPRRTYPRGRLGAHVLGWTNPDSEGVAGVEQAYDDRLAQGGRPLALSLDMRVQFAADEALRAAMAEFRAKAAAAIVTDVQSGEILALVSLPDFDPNTPLMATQNERRNRVISDVYELGSTFKAFAIAAALESRVANMSTYIDVSRPLTVEGHVIRDYHPFNGAMSVAEIFTESSNIGTAKLALATGAERQQAVLKAFGLLDRAPLAGGRTPRPLVPQRWTRSTIATVSFGHGLAVSPLSLASAYGAVANKGVFVAPTLERRAPDAAVATHRALSEAGSRRMLDLMRLVVAEGTGSKADAPGYAVAGKTGTADKVVNGVYANGRRLNSFAAVFPHPEPRWSVLVVLDEPKPTKDTFGFAAAGWNAAPTAGEIVRRIAPMLGADRLIAEREDVFIRQAAVQADETSL
ncbi:MAG: peptidoglycan D,D-transpeptidase FtsI family protein [Maricaulaceae bacterium]